MYITPMSTIFDSYSVTHYSFDDSSQLKKFGAPCEIPKLLHSMPLCCYVMLLIAVSQQTLGEDYLCESNINAGATANIPKPNDN